MALAQLEHFRAPAVAHGRSALQAVTDAWESVKSTRLPMVDAFEVERPPGRRFSMPNDPVDFVLVAGYLSIIQAGNGLTKPRA